MLSDRWSRHRQDGSGLFHGAAARRTRPESLVPLLHPGAGALACGANLKPKPDGAGNQELRRRPFRNLPTDRLRFTNAGVLGEVSLRAGTEALPGVQTQWDAVFIDESQDLAEDDWLLIAELSRGRFLWAFSTRSRHSGRTEDTQGSLQGSIPARQSLSLPGPILALAKCYVRSQPDHRCIRQCA